MSSWRGLDRAEGTISGKADAPARREVELGADPDVPREFGWRFLRGVRSRLVNERPQETSQHRAMREAIIDTSGLRRHLDQLPAGWRGQAATSFATLSAEWRATHERVKEQLQSIQLALAAAGRQYGAVESSTVRMFAG